MPEFGSFDPQGKGFAQSLDVMGATQSMMQRAEAAKRAQSQFEYQQIQNELNVPIEAAQREADLSKALSERQMQEMTQQTRTQMYPRLAQMQQDLDGVMSLEDDEQRANHALELLKRYSQMSLVPEFKPISDIITHIATSIINDYNKTSVLGNTLRDIEKQRKSGVLTEEQAKQATEIAAGIQAKATSGKMEVRTAIDPNGRRILVGVNPDGTAQIIGQDMTDSSGANPFAGPTIEAQKKAAADAQNKAALEKLKPKREASLQQAKANVSTMSDDIDELISLVGPSSVGIAGIASSKIPTTPAYSFAAKLDSLKARIGFETLNALRQASPTGGALGNISNRENDLLQSTLGALKQGMTEKEIKDALKKIRERIHKQVGIIETSFENDYGNLQKTLGEMTDDEIQAELNALP